MPLPKCSQKEVYDKKSKKCIVIGSDVYKNIVKNNPSAFKHYAAKITKATKPLTACSMTQVYNKHTKRCVSISSQAYRTALKKDPTVFNNQKNKISLFFGPKAPKSVNRNNIPLSKMILKFKSPPKSKSPPKPVVIKLEGATVCVYDQVFNKYTGRCVKIFGQSYKLALKKDPTVFDNQKYKISEYKSMFPPVKKTKLPTPVKKIPMKTKLLVPVVEEKVYLPKLTLSSQLKQVFAKKFKNTLKKSDYKIKNVAKYTNISKIPPYAFIEKPITITLYYYNYYTNDAPFISGLYQLFQTPRIINARSKKKMTFEYDNISSNFYKHVIKRDTNPDIIDTKWFVKMQAYISSLSNRERFALYAYTKNGDVYVNLKERGMKLNYDRINMKPFFYEFLEYMTMDGTDKSIITDIKNTLGMTVDEIQKVKKDTEGRELANLYSNFVHLSSKKVKPAGIDILIKMLSDTISRVIKKSPPTTKPMVVFRGVKDCFFAADNFTSKYKGNEVYYNKGFVSTTLQHKVALDTFSSMISRCCFKVITILPGTRCIPLIGLTQFEEEVEILLDRNTKYIIRDKYMAPIVSKGRTHLFNVPTTRKMKISDIIIG